MAERADDAIEERFAAYETVIGQQVGAVGEMLARAEADLEMERAIVAEQGGRGDLAAFHRHAERGQELLYKRRLPLPQLVS